MPDDIQQGEHTPQAERLVPRNGPDPAPKTKTRRIASASFEDAVAKITFTPAYGGGEVLIDVSKIPETIAPSVTAYGAVQIIQTAYSTAADPAGAARKMLDRLYAGDWRPGLPRPGSSKPDTLLLAIAKVARVPYEDVAEKFLPAYAQKHGLADTGVARRKLRAHPDVAAEIARIEADRAKRLAESVRKAPRERLSL